MEPRINVSFHLEGDEFSKEYMWEKLRIEPSRFRTKKDWPNAILNWPVYNPNLPDEYKPRTTWELATGYESCMSVSHQLEKIIKRLEGKEETINQLCKELNLRISFSINIETDAEYFPEMCFEKDEVKFISKIGAEIIFGFHITDV